MKKTCQRSIESRDHVQVLSGTAAILGDREEKGENTDGPEKDSFATGVIRLPFASALFGPTKTIDIGSKGSFAMDPAKNFFGASLINLLLQNPEMHAVLCEMKRMCLTKLLLYIEVPAVLSLKHGNKRLGQLQ